MNLSDYRSRPKSTFDMQRTSGRSAEHSLLKSRKKPIQQFTEKATSYILSYDINAEAVVPKSKVV
jgi:hypothetical protein